MEKVKRKGVENLIPFEKGKSGNPLGRPKKYITLLKEQGYKKSEIDDTIQSMMAMTIAELQRVWDNKTEATVLELTIAAAIRKSITRGSLYSIETLLNRVYGKPQESVDMQHTLIQEQPLFPDVK